MLLIDKEQKQCQEIQGKFGVYDVHEEYCYIYYWGVICIWASFSGMNSE